MNIEINGIAALPEGTEDDEFIDKFIEFIESQKGSFGGGFKVVNDTDKPSPKEIIMEMYIEPLLPVTEATAQKLADYFGTTTQYWINIQKKYDENK